MYTHRPNLLLAFHGCDREVRDGLVLGKIQPEASQNDYDWLGWGMYFWENNKHRGLDWANLLTQHPEHSDRRVKEPAVLGAVISLGNCLDLLDGEGIALVSEAHAEFLQRFGTRTSAALPENRLGPDHSLRYLDCAVINFLHKYLAELGQPPFDSVRAMFPEGEPLYDKAGFRDRNHIQVCVRNSDCIKGFFIPRDENGMIVE